MANARKTERGSKQQIPLEQIEAVVKGAPAYMDAERGQGLGRLAQIKRAKLVQSRRERARVEVRYGADDARVQQADQRMQRQHFQLVNVRVEADRSQLPALVQRDAEAWIVHGFVRNPEGLAVPKASVGLYAQADSFDQPLITVKADSKGYFTLRWSQDPKADKAAEASRKKSRADTEAAASAGMAYMVRAATRSKQPIYLGAEHAGSQRMDGRTLYPVAGTVIYRDIELPHTDSGGCTLRTRYLGNSGNRELHDLQNEKPGCQIANMRPDHRVYFTSEKQAQALGYDFCAKCYGKSRSTR